MANSTLTIQIDETLKEKGEILFNRFGLSITDAINLFLSKSVEEDNLPFDLDEDFDLDGPYSAEEDALLYSPSNVAAILEAKKSLDEGKGISMTFEEFRELSKRIL